MTDTEEIETPLESEESQSSSKTKAGAASSESSSNTFLDFLGNLGSNLFTFDGCLPGCMVFICMGAGILSATIYGIHLLI